VLIRLSAVRLAVLAVVLAVLAAAELPDVAGNKARSRALAEQPADVAAADVVASKTARRAKYVGDGFALATLLAVGLFFAQRAGVRGWALLVLACATVYGALHGIFQGVCGYAAYFAGGGLRDGAGGVCERTEGWEPIALSVAAAIVFMLIIEVRHRANT
jgi:hypothetical protein